MNSDMVQELQNEINCMNDSRNFTDAESARSGQSHVSSQPVFFPPHPDPGGMLSRSLGMPSRNNGPPSIWDTHGVSANFFANPVASSSAPYPQELNPWSPGREEPLPQWTYISSRSETPVWTVSQKNLSSSVEETLQRIKEQTNNDCRIQIFISTNSLHQPRLVAGR